MNKTSSRKFPASRLTEIEQANRRKALLAAGRQEGAFHSDGYGGTAPIPKPERPVLKLKFPEGSVAEDASAEDKDLQPVLAATLEMKQVKNGRKKKKQKENKPVREGKERKSHPQTAGHGDRGHRSPFFSGRKKVRAPQLGL